VTEGANKDAIDGVAPDACHLTPTDLARRWRVSPRTLERWRGQRKGPPWLRLRGRVRYRYDDVLAYEQEHLIVPSVDDPGTVGAP
jgi:hypothetical protein